MLQNFIVTIFIGIIVLAALSAIVYQYLKTHTSNATDAAALKAVDAFIVKLRAEASTLEGEAKTGIEGLLNRVRNSGTSGTASGAAAPAPAAPAAPAQAPSVANSAAQASTAASDAVQAAAAQAAAAASASLQAHAAGVASGADPTTQPPFITDPATIQMLATATANGNALFITYDSTGKTLTDFQAFMAKYTPLAAAKGMFLVAMTPDLTGYYDSAARIGLLSNAKFVNQQPAK